MAISAPEIRSIFRLARKALRALPRVYDAAIEAAIEIGDGSISHDNTPIIILPDERRITVVGAFLSGGEFYGFLAIYRCTNDIDVSPASRALHEPKYYYLL